MISFAKYLGPRCLMLLLAIVLFVYPLKASETNSTAIFAGGCFWCLEHDLEDIEGVISAESGYSGGDLVNPTYRNHQGHQEVVLVTFDSELIDYEKLLRSYWRNIDPFDGGGQFCDRGESYSPIIFVSNPQQVTQANDSFQLASHELAKSLEDLKVEIKDAKKFWPAEDYHQDYAKINSLKYNFYRYSCGRDSRLDEVWLEKARTSQEWKIGP